MGTDANIRSSVFRLLADIAGVDESTVDDDTVVYCNDGFQDSQLKLDSLDMLKLSLCLADTLDVDAEPGPEWDTVITASNIVGYCVSVLKKRGVLNES